MDATAALHARMYEHLQVEIRDLQKRIAELEVVAAYHKGMAGLAVMSSPLLLGPTLASTIRTKAATNGTPRAKPPEPPDEWDAPLPKAAAQVAQAAPPASSGAVQTVPQAPTPGVTITDIRRQRALAYIREHGPASSKDLCLHCDIPWGSTGLIFQHRLFIRLEDARWDINPTPPPAKEHGKVKAGVRKLNARVERIRDYLQKQGPRRATQIGNDLGIPDCGVQSALKTEHFKRGWHALWWLADQPWPDVLPQPHNESQEAKANAAPPAKPPVTDDEAMRSQIHDYLMQHGQVKPVLIAEALHVASEEVVRLVDHEWFRREENGIGVA